MKKNNTSLWLALAIVGLFTQCNSADTEELSRPNVILIMADDLGYETVQANGGTSYQTPNLNKMAEEGIRFEHCYAQPLLWYSLQVPLASPFS